MKNRWKIFTVSALIGVLIVAGMGLASYFPGMEVLGSIKKDYIPMAPSTAVSFIFLGCVLLFLTNNKKSSFIKSTLLLILILFVILFGILDIIGYFIQTELNFEEVFARNITGDFHGLPVGRMSPATGITFFFSGSGILFLFLQRKQSKHKKLLDYLSGGFNIGALISGFVFCLAYFYGNPLLYGNETLIPMAFSTALAFVLLAFASVTSGEGMFPLKFFAGGSTRSYLLRFILPLAIMSALAGGLFTYYSFFIVEINLAIVSAILTILAVITSGVVATFIARHLGKEIDKQKKRTRESELALERSEKQFRTLFETMTQGVVYQNSTGEIVLANTAAERILGLSRDEMIGRKSVDSSWKAVDEDKNDLPGNKHPAMIALETKKVVKNYVQGVFNPKTNNYVWIIVDSIPQFKNGSDEPYQVFSTFLDITERKNAEDKLNQLKNDLEKQVAQRTAELEEKVQKLDISQKAMLYMVEDLNSIAAELKDERRKLEFTNQELEAFTYSVSHDLRAPLRAINGFSNFLTEDYADKLDDEGKRFINTIRDNASKMDQLISELLSLSRVSKTSLKLIKMEMNSVVTAIFSETASAEEQKLFDVTIHKMPPVTCDPNLIKQVWQNLVENALKYSSKSATKKIEIGARKNENETIFYIKDEGAGFDEKYGDKLFGVFQRLHREPEFEGTGVGLAIVQRIIHRHGGKVWAEGKTGKGATFYFTLPG